MRILMLTCHPCIQGPFPKILPLLAASLQGTGCDVATEPWGRHRDDETFFDKIFGRLGDLWRVWRRLRREKFDVLVIHTTTEWQNYARDLPMLWLSRGLVRRSVLEFHGSHPGWVLGPGRRAFKWASRLLFQACDEVLVLSTEEQREWRKFYPDHQFTTVSNPYQARGQARSKPASCPWPLPSGVPILLYAGRLIAQKGIFDLLEALALIQDRHPFHLLMAGTGPEESAVRERAAALGLTGRVTLAGYLTGPQLWQAYDVSDLFVFASWSEGFPTVMSEAMDAGLPMVATRIRGAVDHLQEGVHGHFVPPRDPAAFAAAVSSLLGNPEGLRRMSAANQVKVLDFSPSAVARRYREILEGILSPATAVCPAPETALRTSSLPR